MCDPNERNSFPEAVLSHQEIQAIQEAFDFLYSGLREAKSIFEAGDHAGRDGVIHAVETVLKFLSRYGPVRDERLPAPLAVMMTPSAALEASPIEII